MSDVSTATPHSTHLTRQGIAALQSGRPEEARLKFGAALATDPHNETAWLWLASLVQTAGEKRYCLERALEINPDSVARRALGGLANVRPEVPLEVAQPEDLPLPPQVLDAARANMSRGLSLWWLLLPVLALVGLFAALTPRFGRVPEDVHIAVVGPMTGPAAAVGEEFRSAAAFAVQRINAAGGIDGRRVVLDVYDDQNNPILARQRAEEIVREGRALAVLGHNASTASLAAAPVYNSEGLAAVTPTSTTDAVTQGNPWYFSTIFTNSAQGSYLATYLSEILKADKVTVVYSDDTYGRSLAQEFAREYVGAGELRQSIAIDTSAASRQASIQAAVDRLAADPTPGHVILALGTAEARDLVLKLRRSGVTAPLVGADAVGAASFAELFKDEPEEQRQPGYFTDGMYAASPLLIDSASSAAQALAAAYQEAFNLRPTWRAARIYNAVMALYEAVDRANVRHQPDSVQADREAVRRELSAMTSPETASRGVDGPVYFDQQGAGVVTPTMGQFRRGEVFSAPFQLQPIDDTSGIDVEKEKAAGHIIAAGDRLYWPARIVYTGTALTELSDLDSEKGTLKAHFYVWFRYPGDDDVVDIRFVNAVDDTLRLGEPVTAEDDNGFKYRLYEVTGEFKQDLDYHDYPFDQQVVGIRFQNDKLPRNRVVYAVDRLGLGSGSDQAVVGNDDDRFMAIDNWNLAGPVRHFQDAVVQQSSFGNPKLFGRPSRVEFSEFRTEVTLQRDLISFLARNLLPLALIVVILYVSLFFPHGDMTSDRISVAVTALLTGAVLLSAIQAGLPAVGYTVGIEYGFYVFFILTLVAVLVAMVGGAWHRRGRDERNGVLDAVSRVGFLLVIVGTVAAYVVRYR